MIEWRPPELKASDFVLAPSPHDLDFIAHELVASSPTVVRPSGFTTTTSTLRARLGLTRPTNRYATSE